MPEHIYREILLKRGEHNRYRLAVEFKDPKMAPLGLFLTAEAGPFYKELKETVKEARGMKCTSEFHGNLCSAVIDPDKVTVKTGGENGAEEKCCELSTDDFETLLDEWKERSFAHR